MSAEQIKQALASVNAATDAAIRWQTKAIEQGSDPAPFQEILGHLHNAGVILNSAG